MSQHDSSAASRETVLLVDDSEVVLRTVSALLELTGVTVEQASTATAALVRLRREPRIGLMLLDLNMPQMSGLEVLRLVKADTAIPDLPVVLVSGSRTPEDVTLSQKLGAVEWLQKPVTTEALHAVVERYLPAHGEP